MKETLYQKLQEAKKVHLPAILNKMNYTIYFQNGYYHCWEFPNYRFKASGNGYFDQSVPAGTKGNVTDNPDFVFKHGIGEHTFDSLESASDWLIQAGRDVTSDDIECIPDVSAPPNAASWTPPAPITGTEAQRKLRGFLTRQGMSRNDIDGLVHKRMVFVDEHRNIVFVVQDEDGCTIGHEIVNWGYYRQPTDLNGKALKGCERPSSRYGLDVENLVPSGK